MVIVERVKTHILRDVLIIIFSIFLAMMLVRSGGVQRFLDSSNSIAIIGSFIGGILFTSIFSAAPATVALGQLAQDHSILLVSFFGGLGALLGDLIIYRFVKDSVSEDIEYLLKKAHAERLASIFKLKIIRWIIPFLGALVVASPLPDELGLTILGLSKMRPQNVMPITFFLNFAGILVVSLIARGLL